MTYPMCCFTCGKYMYDKYPKFVELVNKNIENEVENPVFEAFKEFKIWKICCRNMYMSTHDISNLIH
jgi:DNA-directed RNA polymerase subunit N (RpoN/RPB10)